MVFSALTQKVSLFKRLAGPATEALKAAEKGAKQPKKQLFCMLRVFSGCLSAVSRHFPCGPSWVYACNGRALDRVTKQKHRPNSEKLSKKWPKIRSAPPHTGSPGPFGPGTPEESEKSPERVPRGRAPKVPKECAPESQKSPKRVRKSGFDSFRTLLRLRGALFGHFWGPAPGYSFRTLPGFRARRARETLCGAGPNFLFDFIFNGGVHLRKVNCAFTKAASIPAWRQSENAGPRLFGFIFRRCPPSRIYFPILKLSPKAAFAKAAFDTLRFFSCSDEGKGESEALGGEGDDLLLKIPGGGVSGADGGAGGPRAERVFARNLVGGGLNIFFRGRNFHQVLDSGFKKQKTTLRAPNPENIEIGQK